MRKAFAAGVLVLVSGMAFGASREPATLKDVEPTNTPAMKKKHQQLDFSVLTASTSYLCRTPADKSVNATDFVVGSSIVFEVSGKKGEVRTERGKKAKCEIVRVEAAMGGSPQ